MSFSKENLSYPIQKPLKLLDRIIKASSNKGDVVLDPFCGCGTTIEAARELKRKWIGIDVSSFAIDLICTERLCDKTIVAHGIPQDFASAQKMANDNHFAFEAWAVDRIPGLHPTKPTGDGEIDGEGTTVSTPDQYSKRVLAQVKGGKTFKISDLREFIGTVHSNNASIGIFITLDRVNNANARRLIANEGKVKIGEGYIYPRIQL